MTRRPIRDEGPLSEVVEISGWERAAAAVHEAGHVVAYAALTGRVPESASVPIFGKRGDDGAGGKTERQGHQALTVDYSEADLAVAMAGRVAEEEFLGCRNVGEGCWGDMEYAARRARSLVRAVMAGGPGLSFWVPPSPAAARRRELELLQEAHSRARDVLRPRAKLVWAVARLLINDETVDSGILARVLRRGGVEATTSPSADCGSCRLPEACAKFLRLPLVRLD